MFDQFKNLNIDTCSDSELKALIRQTLSVFSLHIRATQELLKRCNDNNKIIPEEIRKPKKIVIANGRTLSEGSSDIKEDDFDVILDMTTNSLRYRKDPVKHTKLEESKLDGIGPRRIEILLCLLEHPTKHISIENASVLPGQLDIVEPNTLSKTISLLRKALGQRGSEDTYIMTKNVWGQRYRHAYALNQEWKYLVIKEEYQ